jgi:hypothetical protein
MPKKVYYVKYVKKTKNILEEYVLKKYGSVNNFLNKFNKGQERKKIENILRKSDFFTRMLLGMKVCGSLRIDFEELFFNGNICALDSQRNIGAEESAEEKYSLLNFSARQKTLEYMNDILKN